MNRPTATPAQPHAQRPLVQARDLAKTFDVSAPWLNRLMERKPRQILHAVDGVSFDIHKGQTLALVGESGCGKTTVGKAVLQLIRPTGGTVSLGGEELTGLNLDIVVALALHAGLLEECAELDLVAGGDGRMVNAELGGADGGPKVKSGCSG